MLKLVSKTHIKCILEIRYEAIYRDREKDEGEGDKTRESD